MERISGNSGFDEKYVVVAKNGNVALGLYLKAARDYNREGHPYSIEGRLRAAAAPDCEATAQEVNDAFKGLPFEKFANEENIGGIVRASCSVGIFTIQQAREGLPQAILALNIGQSVVDFLLKGIDVELLLFGPNQLGEIIRDEIAEQSAKNLSALKTAKKIALSDTDFAVGVDSVQLALTNDLAAATEAYNAAIAQAQEVAEATAIALVEEHAKSHPEFTFYVDEPEAQEFMLQSLMYPDAESFEDDDHGEGAGYDA